MTRLGGGESRTKRTGPAPADRRKKRLEQLLNLALAYKGCTRKELAKTLGRDPTKLVPGTGIPKLDLVVQLALAIDWPIGDVASYLWSHEPPAAVEPADFESLRMAAASALRAGNHQAVVELASAAAAAAEGGANRALACHLEACGWEGLGRYTETVAACNRGMLSPGAAPELQRRIQVTLARAYYALWSLVESASIAERLMEEYRRRPARSARERLAQASIHDVAGQSSLRRLGIEPERSQELAGLARRDLEEAIRLYQSLDGETDKESLEGPANTCRGALVEADVALGTRQAFDALLEISASLDEVRDLSGGLAGPRLESYGWWCIFGCNIALRHLTDERQLHQFMAVLTNKADEIANITDNWSMRERVFSMQYTRWERAAGSTGFEIPCVIDHEDVRVITGTMARFPTFRKTGWRILQTAQIIDG